MKFHSRELTHPYINIGSLTLYLMAVDNGEPKDIASFPTCGFCRLNGPGRHKIQRHYDLKRHKHADSNPNTATALWFVGTWCTQIQSGKICSWNCWGLQDSTGLYAIWSRVPCLCWPTLCHDRTKGDFISHFIQVLILTIASIPTLPCIKVGYCTWTWSYSPCEDCLTFPSFEKGFGGNKKIKRWERCRLFVLSWCKGTFDAHISCHYYVVCRNWGSCYSSFGYIVFYWSEIFEAIKNSNWDAWILEIGVMV